MLDVDVDGLARIVNGDKENKGSPALIILNPYSSILSFDLASHVVVVYRINIVRDAKGKIDIYKSTVSLADPGDFELESVPKSFGKEIGVEILPFNGLKKLADTLDPGTLDNIKKLPIDNVNADVYYSGDQKTLPFYALLIRTKTCLHYETLPSLLPHPNRITAFIIKNVDGYNPNKFKVTLVTRYDSENYLFNLIGNKRIMDILGKRTLSDPKAGITLGTDNTSFSAYCKIGGLLLPSFMNDHLAFLEYTNTEDESQITPGLSLSQNFRSVNFAIHYEHPSQPFQTITLPNVIISCPARFANNNLMLGTMFFDNEESFKISLETNWYKTFMARIGTDWYEISGGCLPYINDGYLFDSPVTKGTMLYSEIRMEYAINNPQYYFRWNVDYTSQYFFDINNTMKINSFVGSKIISGILFKRQNSFTGISMDIEKAQSGEINTSGILQIGNWTKYISYRFTLQGSNKTNLSLQLTLARQL